jgi:hypothetical protein
MIFSKTDKKGNSLSIFYFRIQVRFNIIYFILLRTISLLNHFFQVDYVKDNHQLDPQNLCKI